MKARVKLLIDILICFATGAFCGLFFNILIMKSPIPSLFPSYSEELAGKLFSINIVTGVFLFGLAVPIIEEFIFRIGLYGFLYRKAGFWGAAVISSLIFGIYHMNVVQFIYGFIMGIILCAMYHRDYRGFVPIFVHMGANLAVWLLGNVIAGWLG